MGDQAGETKYAGNDFVSDLGSASLWSPVVGDDTLCLTDPATVQSATDKGQYANCASGGKADPTWDAKTWDSGKVDYQGKDVAWQ